MSQTRSSTDFKVGDMVSVPAPLRREVGMIIEDRGHLGIGGRRLFRVEVPNHPYSTNTLVVDEDEIQHATESEQAELQQQLDPAEIKEFLIDGGLVGMLIRHTPQRVWLLRVPQGVMMFTYIEGYSVTGGEYPPTTALHGEKISASKRDAVIRFIQSFGLSKSNAEDVVRKIGVAS